MQILFTGNLNPISSGVLEQIKGSVQYGNSVGEKNIERIFSTYNFQTVIYFSDSINGCKDFSGEVHKVRQTLGLCEKHGVRQMIYVCTNALADGMEQVTLEACQSLCRIYAEKWGKKASVIKIPYLYSRECTDNVVYQWLLQAEMHKEIEIAGKAEAVTDFICDEDLFVLLSRIIDRPKEAAYSEMEVPGGNACTVKQAAEIVAPSAPVSFLGGQVPSGPAQEKAGAEYGWKPQHRLTDDIWMMRRKVKEQAARKEPKKRSRNTKLLEKTRVVVELVLMFVAAVMLNNWIQDNAMLNFLDFRFFYIVIMGMTNGLYAGSFAALFSCMDYLMGTSDGIHWQILFYNVQNWIPFASYLLVGAASGYIRDKKESEIRFAKEECRSLEGKYEFLNEQYLKVMENKDHFNSQIIGYQDSFGKMYSIVKQLDSTLTSEVFYEAISIIEEMLETRSAAIYSINPGSEYARLNVCSKGIHDEMAKSLKLSEYPEMLKKLKKNKEYVNVTGRKGYPVYAGPIYRDGELLGMILLMDAKESQMNMEYSNKFVILSDLIKDSLIHAMEHEKLSEDMIAGTQIMKAEIFEEIRKINEQMREKEYLEYTLLRVQEDYRGRNEIANQISALVRNSDVLGVGNDGGLYLLLTQTGLDDMEIISERLKKHKIEFEIVKG